MNIKFKDKFIFSRRGWQRLRIFVRDKGESCCFLDKVIIGPYPQTCIGHYWHLKGIGISVDNHTEVAAGVKKLASVGLLNGEESEKILDFNKKNFPSLRSLAKKNVYSLLKLGVLKPAVAIRSLPIELVDELKSEGTKFCIG